ncbi:MAG TPA: AMP-binding protein, partial [Thermodesulfovibrionales bacterium]|nr:AMP-binding protein [Thermodesulfovibrionales bacterium]
MNIPQAFEETAKRNPKAIPLEMEGRGYSYEEILSSSKSIASFLSAKNIKKGDRVAILLEGGPEWGITYLGISFLGAVAVPIDIQLSEDEVINLVQDSESKAIFISEKTLKTFEAAINLLFTNNSTSPPFKKGGEEVDSYQGFSLPHPSLGKGGQEGESYKGKTEGNSEEDDKSINKKERGGFLIKAINIDSEEFLEILKYPHLDYFPSIDPDDMASLIYTSGTTGRPKGVVLTHRNFLSNVRSIQKAKIIDERDCLLSILPLHHSYPFMVNFLVPLLTGAKAVYLQSLKGPDILKTMVEKNITTLVGVPQLFSMLRRGILDSLSRIPLPFRWIVLFLIGFSGFLRDKLRINLGKIIFSSVHKRFGKKFRFFVSGGAKLDPRISQDLEALGFTMLEGYGLTETSPVISFNPLKRIKRGSVGLPLSEAEVKIMNPDKEGVGEIAVKGPNVMKGYYRNPEETNKVISDGWLFTGDLGYVDKEGYLYITGRTKEVIVLSSGKNIYPEEIEKHYLQSPLIKEICVFGIERKQGIADTLHAIVVPHIDYMREKKIANFNEAVKWQINALSAKLPPYKRIMGYEVYKAALPKTTLGKLKRYAIKDILSGKTVKEEVEVSEEELEVLKSPTGKRVVASLERITEKRPVRLDYNLELDLGIDSLARVELIVTLSSAFTIELPDTFMADIYSVRDLIRKIETMMEDTGEKIAGEISKEWKEFFKTEPSVKDQKAVGLVQGFLTRLFIILAMSLLKLIGRIFFKLEVRGVEHIPPPPYIITSNHASNVDGFVIAIGVPIKAFMILYFLGFQKYFSNWFTSRFAKLAHVVPIDPETYLKKALQISGYVLKEGKALCLFPEGGRTYDGNLLPFKKGVGILSKELDVPLVPTLIDGTYEVLPRGALWPKFKKIKVTF